jgi:eukaryotic-like serine/threonine-protein kinase
VPDLSPSGVSTPITLGSSSAPDGTDSGAHTSRPGVSGASGHHSSGAVGPSTPFAVLADRYAVERELGQGGMATVYLAEERKHGRKVAIKVLRPELTASVDANRFSREIQIVARLSHPHIVPLIDSGESEGVLYYVSAYVPGGSLRDRLEQQGPLPIADVLRIANEIGSALAYAHRNDFVHRDVKPENILFAEGLAVLADFGIATACCEPGSEPITASGIAIGTPAYMSPEQASGESNLGPRSDVYSFACVVYEMLAGRPPFQGTSLRATMIQHLTVTPPPLRGVRPDVPPAVETAIARAMAKDPNDRFASITDFVAALGAIDEPLPRFSAAATRAIAVLPFVNASPDPDNEYLSDGITDELIDALAKVSGLRVASRTSVFALKGRKQDVRAIGALLGATVVLEGTVRRAGQRLRITAQLVSASDGRLLWSQRYDRELDDVFVIQDEIAQTIVSTLRATYFADLAPPKPKRYTDNVVAYGLYLRGRFEWNKRTSEAIAEAIRYFEQAIAEDPDYALAYTGLADSYALQLDYRSVPVHEGFERAKEYARKALELDDTVAEAHASLAWVLFIHDWDWKGAEQSFRRAIELNPHYASAHQWYAFLLASQNKCEEGLVAAHTALELDPSSISARRSLGWMYYYARRYEQARDHLSRVIEMNPTAEESYRVLGFVLAEQGNFVEAERVLREAAALHGTVTYAISALGYVLARAGRRVEAERELEKLEEIASHGYVSPVAFATIQIGLGNADAALDWADRAYEERRGWLAYLTVNPLFDPLEGSARFEALVRRMGLERGR